jgi:DNA-binding transcriptional regulator/RsmH inhibitor MraZ
MSAYLTTIDAKGRLMVPSALRPLLGNPVGCTYGPGRALLLFPGSQAPELAQALPGELQAGTFLLPVNSAGRVMLPQQHRRHADLWPGAEAALTLAGGAVLVMRGEAWEARVAAAVTLFWSEWMRKVGTR